MHRFLHGIRRSFLRPVWAPLQRCLPLLALLQCCPEDGDLLPSPLLNQPPGYGDLLPQSGEEDQDGDLLPQSGDEDGEGIPPSQGNEQAVLCDLQPQINWKLGNTLGILSPTSNGVASAFSDVFHDEHEWSAPRGCSVKALQQGHFMKMFEVDAVLMRSLSVARTFVFDPGGLSCLHDEVPSACHPASMTPHRRSTFAADHQHLLDVGAAPTLMAAGLSYGEANCRFSDNQCKVLLLMEIIQDDFMGAPCG